MLPIIRLVQKFLVQKLDDYLGRLLYAPVENLYAIDRFYKYSVGMGVLL